MNKVTAMIAFLIVCTPVIAPATGLIQQRRYAQRGLSIECSHCMLPFCTCHCLLVIGCNGASPHPSGITRSLHHFDEAFDVLIEAEHPDMVGPEDSQTDQDNSELGPLGRRHSIESPATGCCGRCIWEFTLYRCVCTGLWRDTAISFRFAGSFVQRGRSVYMLDTEDG